MAHFGQSGISPDEHVAYATVTFEGATFDDLDSEDILDALEPIEAQNGEDGLQVGANGVFAFVSGEEPSSESIGVAVALVILLFAFGALAGALLPIVSAAGLRRDQHRFRPAAGRSQPRRRRCSRRSWRR